MSGTIQGAGNKAENLVGQQSQPSWLLHSNGLSQTVKSKMYIDKLYQMEISNMEQNEAGHAMESARHVYDGGGV